MAAIALVASALAILPSLARVKVGGFGELAPFDGDRPLRARSLAIVSSGRLRRFFAGLATTGFVVGLAFWLASILDPGRCGLSVVILPDR